MVAEQKHQLKISSFKVAFLVATIIGLTVAGFMMWVAFQHNPQGEYCKYIDSNNCELQWLNLSRVGLFSFVPILLVVGAGVFILGKAGKFFKRKLRTPSNPIPKSN